MLSDLRQIPYIREATEHKETLRRCPLIRELLQQRLSDEAPRRQKRPPRPLPAFIGNPDLALLKAENQCATHVTPLIAELAKGYFAESLHVVGHQNLPPRKADIDHQKADARKFLKDCITRVRAQQRNKPTFSVKESQHSWYAKEATIGEERYEVPRCFFRAPSTDPNTH
jgi:DNA (cytosine-5)-methyltransferase 1